MIVSDLDLTSKVDAEHTLNGNGYVDRSTHAPIVLDVRHTECDGISFTVLCASWAACCGQWVRNAPWNSLTLETHLCNVFMSLMLKNYLRNVFMYGIRPIFIYASTYILWTQKHKNGQGVDIICYIASLKNIFLLIICVCIKKNIQAR